MENLSTVVANLILDPKLSLWRIASSAIMVSLLSWLASQMISRFFSSLWRRGYDKDKKLLALKRTMILAVGFIGFGYFIQYLYNGSQLLALGICFVLLIIILSSQRSLLDNIISGFFLLIQNQIKIGNWITYDHLSGNVLAVRLLQTKLKSEQGDLIYIPNSKLLRGITIVKAKEAGFPLDLKITLVDGNRLSLEDIQQLAITSPFRKANSDVMVQPLNFNFPQDISIRFYVWSPLVVNQARQQFFAGIQSELKGGSPEKAGNRPKVPRGPVGD